MTRKIMSVALVALVVLMPSVALADVYKHKTTGEKIEGTLTGGKINDKTVFRLDGGGNRLIDADQWEIVEGSESKTTEDTTEDANEDEKPDATAKVHKKKARVYVIPIRGAIMSKALARATVRSLEEAKRKRCDVILFHIDTPGGRVDVASRMIEIIEGTTWAKVVSWVEGTEQSGAISAGAFICMGTEKIFMAPGMSLGGAVPWHATGTGSLEVDAKFQSIFQARFRALAQKRGHPEALADAMVNSRTSVVQVFVDDKQRLVTEEQARQLQRDHRDDGKFRRGKTVSRAGEVVTLTTDEAVEYKLASGVAKDINEVMTQLGHEDFQVFKPRNFTKGVTKTANDEKQKFEKAKNLFNSSLQLALESDPARFLYPEQRGTARWKAMTKTAMKHLKICAKAMKVIEDIADDPDADTHIAKEELDELKSQLSAFYKRLGTQQD